MPGDDWFDEISPMVWLWMYMSWIEDQNEEHKFARDYGTFIGSFSNPEAAQKMAKRDDPEYELSDEDFQGSIDRVIRDRDKVIGEGKSGEIVSKRRRKRVIRNG